MKIFGLVIFPWLVYGQMVLSLPNKIKSYTEHLNCTVTEFAQVSAAVASCDDLILDNILVPGGKTLRLPLKDGTKVTFRGHTTFEYAEWEGPLVVINGTNVLIEGEEDAIIDGQGQLYWDGQGEWGSLKPKFFTIQLHNSTMKDIYILNSPVHCVNLVDSTDVEISHWVIDNAAGDEDKTDPGKFGHNTDGFDLYNVTNVVLKDSAIYNQDDCVAIRCGANILVDNFYCRGGHGLSISVGFSNESTIENTLQNVTFQNSILQGGENGIHIKTHVDAGTGLIHNVTYRWMSFVGPSNYGINIQQNYRNLPANSTFPSDPKNNIPIRNLILDRVSGLVEPSAVPIYILCADQGCFDWTFTDVDVRGSGENSCNYVPDGFSC